MKISGYGLAFALIAMVLLLGACATADLTGVSLKMGTEREPTAYENVEIYSLTEVQRIDIEYEEDLKSHPHPPEYYEYIGYVEGICEASIPKVTGDIHEFFPGELYEKDASPSVSNKNKARSCTLEQLKKNAAAMGANAVFLTSINYVHEGGYYEYLPSKYELYVVAGWAVYVPPKDLTSDNARKIHRRQEGCKKVQIYIEPPWQCQILGDVSSRQEFLYRDVWEWAGDQTPSDAIGEALNELKKTVIKMDGNALYIKEIALTEEFDQMDGIMDALFDSYVLDPIDKKLDPEGYKRKKQQQRIYGDPDVYINKYYIISGQAICVPCDE